MTSLVLVSKVPEYPSRNSSGGYPDFKVMLGGYPSGLGRWVLE
jgi:hypothetical protein